MPFLILSLTALRTGWLFSLYSLHQVNFYRWKLRVSVADGKCASHKDPCLDGFDRPEDAAQIETEEVHQVLHRNVVAILYEWF